MLIRKSLRPTLFASAYLATLWGCRSTGLLAPVELGPANGKVERSYEEPVARAIPAVFKALDDQGIRPVSVVFRDETGEKPMDVEGADEAHKNALLLKKHNVLESEEIDLPDGKTMPFKVSHMMYNGLSRDNLHVAVVVKSTGEDTEVSARIGLIGDSKRGRALLDSVTGRLEAEWKIPDEEPPKEKIPTFKRTLPLDD